MIKLASLSFLLLLFNILSFLGYFPFRFNILLLLFIQNNPTLYRNLFQNIMIIIFGLIEDIVHNNILGFSLLKYLIIFSIFETQKDFFLKGGFFSLWILFSFFCVFNIIIEELLRLIMTNKIIFSPSMLSEGVFTFLCYPLWYFLSKKVKTT